MPRPRVSRPLLSTSSEAACLAKRSGLACGKMLTPVPKRIVFVAAATCAREISGSRNHACGEIGIFPLRSYGYFDA